MSKATIRETYIRSIRIDQKKYRETVFYLPLGSHTSPRFREFLVTERIKRSDLHEERHLVPRQLEHSLALARIFVCRHHPPTALTLGTASLAYETHSVGRCLQVLRLTYRFQRLTPDYKETR